MSIERRKYPRVDANSISLKLKSGQFNDVISQSLNISASGVYCKVENEIPLMSRLGIILMIPAGKKTKKIETEGVIVRQHPVIEDGKVVHYDIAVFFDNISAKERGILKNYIEKGEKC